MILTKKVLARVATGDITVAFRRWKRATVKAGGHLRTSIGELAIEAVDRITLDDITDDDIVASGSLDREDLARYRTRFEEGDVYRIRFALAGPDPRIARRERAQLSDDEFEEIRTKLARLDAASPRGPWTEKYLRLIEGYPDALALDLAQSIGIERLAFKANVRKLKEHGLTESRRPGYRLSPCGIAYLARLDGGRRRTTRSAKSKAAPSRDDDAHKRAAPSP